MDEARQHGLPPEEDGRVERTRIERVYHAYSQDPYYRRIWSGDAAHYILERKWEEIARIVQKEQVDIPAARLLDLGAGDGGDCDRFRQLGFRPERIVAIDLLRESLLRTKTSRGWLAVLQADAARLPFRDATFEVVYQSTMLSSILDRSLRGKILHGVRRVLSPQGLFLSYDTRYPNPWNRNTSPVSSSELRAAFPGWRVSAHSTTPIPQLARLVGKLSKRALRVIEAIPLLRSHLLAIVRRPG